MMGHNGKKDAINPVDARPSLRPCSDARPLQDVKHPPGMFMRRLAIEVQENVVAGQSRQISRRRRMNHAIGPEPCRPGPRPQVGQRNALPPDHGSPAPDGVNDNGVIVGATAGKDDRRHF
jgi:hypothetical protein